MAALTDEQLVYAGIGEFSGSLSIIGEASRQVAGAAGESTSKAPGIPAMVMADGPAGIRVAQKFYRDEKGAHAVGLPCIGVLYGYGDRKELMACGAEVIVEDVAELRSLLLSQ